jgi:hypothetical protein
MAKRRFVKYMEGMKLALRWMGIVCAVGVLALLLTEGVLRFFWPELFPHHTAGLYVPHPVMGHVLAPGREIRVTRPEYTVTVRTNAEGFRGAELAPKGADTIRILCLGDWLTFGEGAEEHETYPVLLEHALRRSYPERDIQVINAGLQQYGTLDELIYLEQIAPKLQPDFVIVQFYAGDDFEQIAVPSRARHEFQDGTLEQRQSFTDTTGPRWLSALNWLKHRSQAVYWISERVGQLAMKLNLLSGLEQASSSHFNDVQARQVQELLTRIQAAGEGVGAHTLFMFAPEKMQVMARQQPPLRAATLVESVAGQTGSGFIDLTPLLLTEDVDRLYVRTVGTWKAPAYRLAAEAVTKHIVERGWIDAAQ